MKEKKIVLPTMMGKGPQRVGPGPGGLGFDPRVKAAFDAQNREILQVSQAFNTMRMFVIALIEKYEPETKTAVLSATELNHIGENLKTTGIRVENPPLAEEVTLTVTSGETETMSVSMDSGEMEKNVGEMPPPPTPEEIMEKFPESCTCGHLDSVHIGKVGHCKANDDGIACDCRMFVEKKIVV